MKMRRRDFVMTTAGAVAGTVPIKATGSQRTSGPSDVSEERLLDVLIESSIAVGQGLGNAELSDEALRWWQGKFKTSFRKALEDDDWDTPTTPNAPPAKKTILRLARIMGRRAVFEAMGGPIEQKHAIDAAKFVKLGQICAGRGKYCQDVPRE